MNQQPHDPNNPGTSQQVPPHTHQGPPPGYQQPPPGYQQPPPGAYQQVPPGYNAHGAPAGMQVNLPNASGAMVCGIIGIVLSLGLFGIILNIIAISLAAGAINKYNQNPGMYTESSLSKAKAGRTCGIIGLGLFGLALIIIIAANA